VCPKARGRPGKGFNSERRYIRSMTTMVLLRPARITGRPTLIAPSTNQHTRIPNAVWNLGAYNSQSQRANSHRYGITNIATQYRVRTTRVSQCLGQREPLMMSASAPPAPVIRCCGLARGDSSVRLCGQSVVVYKTLRPCASLSLITLEAYTYTILSCRSLSNQRYPGVSCNDTLTRSSPMLTCAPCSGTPKSLCTRTRVGLQKPLPATRTAVIESGVCSVH